jgi:hypothetical protein
MVGRSTSRARDPVGIAFRPALCLLEGKLEPRARARNADGPLAKKPIPA